VIRPVLAGGRAPAAKAALILVAGTLAGTYAGRGAAAAAVLAAVSAASLLWLSARGTGSAVSRLAFFGLWAGVGFASGQWRVGEPGRDAARVYAGLPEAQARPADVVEGTLSDFWSGRPPRARTTLSARRLRVGSRWRDFEAEVVVFVSGETPVAKAADRGDRVRLTGRLEEEDLPASDRELARPWPRFRLSVKSARLVERRGATLVTVLTWPNRWLFGRLPEARLDAGGEAYERDVRGPLAALLLGRTSELDRGMVARYRRGGLYHLLVVSGQHVVLEAGLVLFLLSIAGVEGRPRDLLLLAAVFLFVLIGGANPPAVRAGVVVGVFLVTRLLERPIGAAQAIGLSALVLFLAAPAAMFSVGTVLTFAAVCGIALFTRPIRVRLPGRPEWLWSGLAGTLAAEAATAPILFWRFNIVAAGAWLTSPLAIPLSAALIALGGGLLVFYAAGLPGGLLAALFAMGTRTLEWLADRAAGAAFLRPTPPLAGIVAVELLLAAAALGPRRLRGWAAWGAAAVFGALALRPGPAGPERGFSLEALDVGQGDAILLRWKRRAILVDGGGPFDPEATEFGRTRVVPKLLDRGVTRLDAVVLTHPHPDHALGLFAVLEELPVAALWHSSGTDEGAFHSRLTDAATRRGVAVRALAAGDRLDADGLTAAVLHSGGPLRKLDGVNNQSVVLRVERDGRAALLTGDIGAATEEMLRNAGEASLRADVLKIAHHGSRTSTTAAFVDAVAPGVAVISCGRRNRFGHPARPTLEVLGRRCIPVLRTDERSDCRVELLPGATRLAWRGLERP
jgi:competence protein ComEC